MNPLRAFCLLILAGTFVMPTLGLESSHKLSITNQSVPINAMTNDDIYISKLMFTSQQMSIHKLFEMEDFYGHRS